MSFLQIYICSKDMDDQDLQDIRELQADQRDRRDLEDVRRDREFLALQQIRRYRQVAARRGRRPNVYRVRGDAMRDMSDAEFKRHFRLEIHTICKIVRELGFLQSTSGQS
jgi:hypothetical protein